MIKKILDLYFEKTQGYYPFFKYCPPIYREHYLIKRTENILGYKFDYHNPTTFNEKVRYLIYNEKPNIKSILTDKIKVKTYISEKIGSEYCASIYGIWDKVSDIDFSYLPNKFLLKANHAWNMNLFIENKDWTSKNIKDLTKCTKGWLNLDYYYYSMEPQYRSIQRKLFVEEILPVTYETCRQDYSVHCFNGKPIMVEVGQYPSTPIFYDLDWKVLPYTLNNAPIKDIIAKPVQLEQMKEFSKKLSEKFAYVRVDFLLANTSLYVLELTFTPHSAMMPFSQKAFDDELGSMIKLPVK